MPNEIMKIPCPVARDLMTLGESGRYADTTRPMLEGHLAQCPACAKIFADMARPAAVEAVSGAESAAFRESARRLRRKNPLRTALNAVSLSLLTLILVLLGVNGYSRLTFCDYDVPMAQYDYELFRTEKGNVYGHLQFKEGVRPTIASLSLSGPNDGVLEIIYSKPIINTGGHVPTRSLTDWLYLICADGKLLYFEDLELTKTTPVKEIRLAYQNSDGYRVLWREGEDIPALDQDHRPRQAR